MRRFLVLFLILLFPLNVFALSMSAATAQQGQDGAAALAVEAKASMGEVLGDADPDEPPSMADLHDILHHEPSLRLAGPPARAVPPHDAARYSHSLPPPLKPPCVA